MDTIFAKVAGLVFRPSSIDGQRSPEFLEYPGLPVSRTCQSKIDGTLDVHQKFITVGIRCRLETGKLFAEVRTFGTLTRDLMALADYLEALGVTHVAMESTGVLWKPVWNILESRRFTLLLVNPRQVKQVPGRESDVSDAEWIAQLLQCGLLPSSFVPKRELRTA